MIRAIIIEDEKKSRETLAGLLRLYCKNVQVVAEAEGVITGLHAIRVYRPDVIFLDIQMPDGSGFKLLESLEEIDFEIIFTTAYDEFAIKAIRYSALDYLLKPIFPEDLMGAIRRLEARKDKLRSQPNVDVLLENVKQPAHVAPRMVLSTAEKKMIVSIDQIIRCESDNYYTTFFMKDGSKIMISKTLKENEELLAEHNFVRPHKSHLVNTNFIQGYVKAEGGQIVMTDGSVIPVSRRKREMILEVIKNMQLH